MNSPARMFWRRMMVAGAVAPLPACCAPIVGATPELAVGLGWAWAALGGVAVATSIGVWLRSRRGRRESGVDRHWRELLAMTDCMVWEAEVRCEGGQMHWVFTLLQPSRLYRRLAGDKVPSVERGLWLDLRLPDQAEMDARSAQAMLNGKKGYEQDFRLNAEGRTFWLHETAAIERTGPDRWHVAAVVTDETARHEAEEARRRSEQRLERLAAELHAMLWQAQVTRRSDGKLHWDLFLPRSELYRRLFRDDPGTFQMLFWASIGVPEAEEMTLRAREAILGGRTGYEQEFHVPRPEGDIWLREQVTIRAIGESVWELVGVVVDSTRRRLAEETRRAEEAQLHQLLSAANCLLWRGEVRRLDDGTLHWDTVTSRSVLYQQIFGDPPAGTPCRLDWHRVTVPENREIDDRARAAVLAGRAGYTQEFRVLLPGQVLWLHEQVTIAAAGADRWQLVGVVVDITTRREVEEAQRAHEEQLARILDVVECMLWQGRVVDRGNGHLHWVMYIPQSRLFREVFGEEPGAGAFFRWERVVDARTDLQIDGAAERAILGGERGYAQEFRAHWGGRAHWLHEQVAIEAKGPGEWTLVGVITDVTRRHEAEEAKQAHQRQLEKIFDVVDCLLWRAEVTERAGGALHWLVFVPGARLYHKLFGPADPDPRTALNWNEANVPECAEMDRRSTEAIRAGAPGYEQEFRALVGGKTYWLYERTSITRVAFDRWELVGVVVDVTARRLAEQEVRQSELRYRTLFQHTPVAMVEMDFSAAGRWLQSVNTAGGPDLATRLERDRRLAWRGAGLVRVLDCNEMALRVFGATTRADLQTRRRWLLAPETLAVVRAVFVAVAEGRRTFEAETGIRDFSGRHRRMLVRWWIGDAAGGADLQRAVLVLVDLTDLKRAEAALAAEKERLAVTLRAMAEGVVTTDTDGRVRFINPAAAAITQWAADAAVGRPIDEVCALRIAEGAESTAVPVQTVLQGDNVVDLPAHTVLAGRAGAQRLIEGCCAPIHAADSAVVGTVLVFRDITERDRLEQELQRASKLESIGLLAGGIAHDFNNILTAVMGNIALAKLDVEPESTIGRTLDDADRAALRARDLTQQLLTFARGGEPIRSAVRLPEIVTEVARFALHGSKVKAEFVLPEDLWPADVDKAQISRVVQNLVINAVQAMPSGGVVRIVGANERIGPLQQPALAAGSYVRLSVVDTGVGIKPEHLDRVFEPYFTTKQTGSGLGLATVYSIVRKHKGLIQVESALGRGTTFHVYLPAAEQGLPLLEPAAPAIAGAIKGRVLFMDDEAPIRRMVTLMLRRLGCEVEVTGDGAEAVERYLAESSAGRPFDLVIVDLTVPGGMGGLEAVERIRAVDPQVKAIVSSGYSSDPVLANHRTYGFAGRVAKPYELDEFRVVLREVLGGK